MPTIYPMSTYTLTSHASQRRASASASESPRGQNRRYYHSKQTSLSKIKPKMIYISTTPGISIMPSDSIFGSPEPILRDTPSNNPFLTNTNTNPTNEKDSAKPTVAISIKPIIDRFDTISSCGSQSSSGKPKLKPRTEEMFQEGPERKQFRERQEERRLRRKERLVHGQGSGDLGRGLRVGMMLLGRFGAFDL